MQQHLVLEADTHHFQHLVYSLCCFVRLWLHISTSMQCESMIIYCLFLTTQALCILIGPILLLYN